MYTFDIGIITFEKRFHNCFIPLINSIRQFNTDSDILVNINGTFKSSFNEEYRKKILKFISEQNNIFPFIWTEFRGLSKLWNNCIINSNKEYILIINDDMVFTDKIFFDNIQKEINNRNSLFQVNNGFSIYVISKTIAIKLGFFDERLLCLGNEDTEFCVRYGRMFNKQIPNIKIPGVKHIADTPVDDYKKGTTQTKSASMFNEQMFKMILNGQISPLSEGMLYPCEEFYIQNKCLL